MKFSASLTAVLFIALTACRASGVEEAGPKRDRRDTKRGDGAFHVVSKRSPIVYGHVHPPLGLSFSHPLSPLPRVFQGCGSEMALDIRQLVIIAVSGLR